MTLRKGSFKEVREVNIIVQKFGGTSVSTKEKREKVIQKIKKAKNQGFDVVVVVSAMGRKGDAYSTDSLLDLIDISRDNNKRITDMLMCCGEIISSAVISSELVQEGIEAIPLTGGQAGIITDDEYSNAAVIRVQKENILTILKQGKTPIVAGFQGMTEDGFFTTIGRGGSDTSASLIGASLCADRIEIYTDVDGIMTADPRIVKNAEVINVLSYDEVFQLADHGAKVIHPRAVEIARDHNISLYIKNTMNDSEGTIINNISKEKNNRIITSITSTNNRIQVIVDKEDNINNAEYDNILDMIAYNNISLDLINIFPEKLVFTIEEYDKEKLKNIFNKLKLKYFLKENCSKIALIGSGMRGIPGVMAKIYKALSYENIEVLQTADSHMTIWCLISTTDLKLAINALHSAFVTN